MTCSLRGELPSCAQAAISPRRSPKVTLPSLMAEEVRRVVRDGCDGRLDVAALVARDHATGRSLTGVATSAGGRARGLPPPDGLGRRRRRRDRSSGGGPFADDSFHLMGAAAGLDPVGTCAAELGAVSADALVLAGLPVPGAVGAGPAGVGRAGAAGCGGAPARPERDRQVHLPAGRRPPRPGRCGTSGRAAGRRQRAGLRGVGPGPLRYVASGAGISAGLRLGHQAELAAERYGLGALPADRLEQWGVADLVGRRGDELSHGEHRAAVLAVALAGTPEVVLLDEPSVALDIERQDLLIADLHRVLAAGAAVVIASHDRWLLQAGPGDRDRPPRSAVGAHAPPLGSSPEGGVIARGTHPRAGLTHWRWRPWRPA